jgi:hypothetical protein
VNMQGQMEGTPATLRKGDRPGRAAGSLPAAGDSLVHLLRPERGADDRVALRGQRLGRGPPIPQGDRPRHHPWAAGAPGQDLRDEGGGGLGQAPPGTRRTQPAPLAAAGAPPLLVAEVTAQPEDPGREDATRYGGVACAFHRGGAASGVRRGVERREPRLQRSGHHRGAQRLARSMGGLGGWWRV